jgi:hypothetical protein
VRVVGQPAYPGFRNIVVAMPSGGEEIHMMYYDLANWLAHFQVHAVTVRMARWAEKC